MRTHDRTSCKGQNLDQNTMRWPWEKIEAVFALHHCQHEKRDGAGVGEGRDTNDGKQHLVHRR
jgi:hypothetical protein